MNKKLSIFQPLLWLSMVVVMVGLIFTGIITNITLRSVEKQLPRILLTELNDLSLIIENLSDVVIAARVNQDSPNLNNLNVLRKKIEPVYKDIVRFRESYVIDNMVQASAFHAIVAPAIADLQIWLYEGVSGLKPEDKTTAKIIFLRINDAYQKSRLVNRESRIGAQTKLIEQQKRLGHFITNANSLFVLTIIITFGMVFLLIRQYALQLRESEAQSELKKQRDLLTVLFENISLGITLWGKTDNFLFSNNGFTEITGYSKNDIKTLDNWFSLAYPDREYRKKVLDTWNEDIIHEGAGKIREFKIKCKNGDTKHIEFRSAFLKNEKISVLTDVTLRKESENMLREKDRLQGVLELSGAVCHELSQPLMSVLGYFDLILMDRPEDDPFRSKINKIQTQLERITNLTKKIMKISRYQTKDYLNGKILDITATTEHEISKQND